MGFLQLARYNPLLTVDFVMRLIFSQGVVIIKRKDEIGERRNINLESLGMEMENEDRETSRKINC